MIEATDSSRNRPASGFIRRKIATKIFFNSVKMKLIKSINRLP
jgi:hypothetical protein